MIDFAIIGGTGLNRLFEGCSVEELIVSTPFGACSAPIQKSVLFSKGAQVSKDLEKSASVGKTVVFLARHGQPHTIPPHLVNYRANLMALKQLSVKSIIAINAVGGIHADMCKAPHIVIPHQIIDYSYGRAHTYSGCDVTVELNHLQHIDFTHPFDLTLREKLIAQLNKTTLSHSSFGVYGCTQGPRLETTAEIKRMQRDGCDIVGMTMMPEAALARELNIPYAAICLVVNPAAGLSETEITMDDIKKAVDVGMSQVVDLVVRLIEAEV